MKNKSITALLAMLAVTASSVSALPAGAAPENAGNVPVSPQYTYASYATSDLSISGSTATCTSEGQGKSNVARVNATQYLEKKNLLGKYTISVNSWFKQTNSNYLYMRNTESGLGSGTYRVRTVFTFYVVGDYESPEVNSSDVKK